MELNDAKDLALTLMQAHGVGDWHFAFNRQVKAFGQTSYSKRTISLSAPLTALQDERHVADTILHEIAHALTPGALHGIEWQRVARQLGAIPAARSKSNPGLPPRLVARCSCGKSRYRERRPRQGTYFTCRRCRETLVWVANPKRMV